jgi:hypothetical protein
VRPIRFLAIAAAALAAACSNPEGSASQPGSAPAASSASNEPLLGPDDAIASQEEADQEAETSINEQNADAEFDKLEKELAEGTPGGG